MIKKIVAVVLIVFLILGSLLILSQYYKKTHPSKITLKVYGSFKGDLTFGHLYSQTVYVKNFVPGKETWSILKNYSKKVVSSETDRNIIVIFFFDTENYPPIAVDQGHSICGCISAKITLPPDVIKKEGYNKHYIALYCKCHNREEFIKYPAPLKSIFEN